MIHCFRVMVLDQGNIVEFDTPTALLDEPETKFYSMAKDAGLTNKTHDLSD